MAIGNRQSDQMSITATRIEIGLLAKHCYISVSMCRRKRPRQRQTENGNTNENQRQWKLCSQVLFAEARRRSSENKMARKKNKFVYYVVVSESRRDMKTKRRKKWPYKSIPLTRYLRDYNPLFIYRRFAQEPYRKRPREQPKRFHVWSSVRCSSCVCVWHRLEHTSDHRWNNKSSAHVVESRHNLVRSIQCSLYFYSGCRCFVVHFPRDFHGNTQLDASKLCFVYSVCGWRASCHHTIIRHSLFAH